MQIFSLEERNILVARGDGRCMRQENRDLHMLFLYLFLREE